MTVRAAWLVYVLAPHQDLNHGADVYLVAALESLPTNDLFSMLSIIGYAANARQTGKDIELAFGVYARHCLKVAAMPKALPANPHVMLHEITLQPLHPSPTIIFGKHLCETIDYKGLAVWACVSG